jgi:hypothetical protein
MSRIFGEYGATGNVHTEVWWENLRERDHVDDQGVDERIILKLIFKNLDNET